MKRTIHTDRQEVGDGAAEAARWVEDALTNARRWFPEMSESELRGPLEQAFELARDVGRGEREFHEVFEAELRRAVEEQDVLGAAGSVLPAESAEGPKAFPAVGVGESAEVAAPEQVDGDREEREATPSPEDERARLFVLEVGALRFHDDLSPEEIQDELGVDAEYYSRSMRWLLGQVDRSLDGDYPAHVDRGRMARFAAGLEPIEGRFTVERHVRDCPGCATYLADLLDATVRAVERGEADAPGPAGERATSPRTTVSYTNDNAWIFFGRARRRRRHGTPAMSLKAAELRKYGQSLERASIPQPEVLPEPSPAEQEQRTAPRAAPAARRMPRRSRVRRFGPGRRALGPVVLLAAAAVVAVILAALSGGGDEGASPQSLASMKVGELSTSVVRQEQAREAARRRAARAARERAERKLRRERAERKARHERRAARQQEEQSAPAAPAPTSVDPVAPAPAAPPTQSAPPAVAQTPAPSPPSGSEFGPEP